MKLEEWTIRPDAVIRGILSLNNRKSEEKIISLLTS